MDVKNTAWQTLEWFFPSTRFISLEKIRNPDQPQSDELYKRKVLTAFSLLEESAAHLNPDAIYTLADMNFYGNYTHKQDFPKSLQFYQSMASLTGNSTAQFMVGLMYSTGMFGTTPINQAKAHLYYTFAAEAGNMRAQMAIGFRHLSGIGTPASSEMAIKYYKDTADKSFQYFFSGPSPSGRFLERPSWILPNDDGGLYGQGASFVSSGYNAKNDYPSGVNTVEDAIEYFHYLAEENKVVYAHFVLAMLYYEGGKTMDSDFGMAVEYAKRGAGYLWNPDGSPNMMRAKLNDFSIKQGSHCAGFVGSRYLNGQGVPQDYKEAKKWFLRGIEYNDYISLNSLGFMYYHGLGVKKDLNLAVRYFKQSADMKYGPAHFNLGYAYYQRNHPGDAKKAYEQFDLASKKRNFPSWYYKGLMLYNGFPGKEKSIERPVIYFKIVSEAVEELHSPLKWAHDKFRDKDYGSAILGFLIAAEQGYETAQMNLAYLLDEQRGFLDLSVVKQKVIDFIHGLPLIRTAPQQTKTVRNVPREKTALVYWTRAARQLNCDAMVKMGDYYFNGIGTEQPDAGKAAACYHAAGDNQNSLAMWNLGWMHENGIGAEQSYHLAKRYYDLAAATTDEAFFPVQLALLKLRIRSFWSSISNGPLSRFSSDEDDLSSDGEDDSSKTEGSKTFREGLVQMWRYWRDTSPTLEHRRAAAANGEDAAEEAENLQNTIWDDGVNPAGDDDEDFELESSLDSLIVFVIVTLFGAFMWHRQRQQVRLQEELRRRAAEQVRRRANEGQEEEEPEPEVNRFMFLRGEGWAAGI